MSDHTQENRDYWEQRGRGDAPSPIAVTMLAEHVRFLDFVHRREIAFLRRQFARVGARRLLDIGCGAGRLALALAPDADAVVGTDIAVSMIERAREAARAQAATGVRFEAQPLEDPYPAGPWDAVIFSGVLNAVEEAAARDAVGRAAEATRSGGVVYLRNNCANRAPFYVEGSETHPPTFYRTSAWYRDIVERAGLRVEHDDYLFPPLCVPNLVYYHAIPRRLRDRPWVASVLDRWFVLEEKTADVRLAVLGPAYRGLLRYVIPKPTAFRVLIARKA